MTVLETIQINNFVLAKNITIHLKNGFNVFSGETGAGKTLILNAIRYGMGDPFNKDIFRNATPYPHVQLIFNLSHNQQINRLSDYLDEGEMEACCERWMTESGKSRVKINGKFFSLPEYQQFCKNLINIHGQNSLDDLLSRKKQLFLFDSYFKDEINPLLSNFSQQKKLFFELTKELDLINESNSNREREIDFISFQMKEIESAHIKPGEMEELKKERNLLSSAQKIISQLRSVSSLFFDENQQEGTGILSKINSVTNYLSTINNLSKDLDNIYLVSLDVESILKDMAREVNLEIDKTENSYQESKLNDIITRIDQLSHLLKKYGPTEEDVILSHQKFEEELEHLTLTELSKEEKQRQRDSLQLELLSKGEWISTTRKKLKSVFEEKVNQELKDLSMENANFIVDFSMEKDETRFGIPMNPCPVKLFDTGFDRIEFKIRTNPGQPELPISQIASGGELSRIMLAIKTIIGSSDAMQTLLFDEIDTGIGGSTGNAVGEKLRHLGSKQQIVCITHLPQIASKANCHYHIEKRSTDDFTEISIQAMNQQERIEEIARMLDGNTLSETSLQHAREMIRND